MSLFDTCFTQLIGNEGGISNSSDDPGGLTKYGISQRSYPGVDIANLTLDEAKAIYQRDYWDRAQCDRLPAGIAFDVFDTAVNSGIGQAIRFLQRAVGVADDGVIGPMTLAAISRVEPEAIQARFNGQRLDFMTFLTTWDVFSRGWARRIAKNLQSVGV